jgi:branched-chain amino acid transport system permease protein
MLVAMVVIGGMGSVGGTLLGVAVLIFVPELLRSALSTGFESWRYLLFGAALVIMAVYRPQGLWPSRRRTLELQYDPPADEKTR